MKTGLGPRGEKVATVLAIALFCGWIFRLCNPLPPTAEDCREAQRRVTEARTGKGPWEAKHWPTLARERKEACANFPELQ